MILITGSAGKTGRAIIHLLAKKRYAVRAFVHKNEHAEQLKQWGATDIFVGNLLSRTNLEKALQGVQTIYHICPNMHPQEQEIGDNVISAAIASGCSRIVYHSVLHPQTQSMPHHWNKLMVEESLLKSGLRFTILQPCAYMQNISAEIDQMINNKVHRIPYRATSKFSLVDLNDVAEVVYKIIASTAHDGATYELNGPEILTLSDIGKLISAALQLDIAIEQQSIDIWKREAATSGFSEYKIVTLIKMFHYYDQFGFWGNGPVLEWLLGRKPTTFHAFLIEELKAKGLC